MFEEMLKNLEGVYSQEDLKILEQVEQILSFQQFDDYDVLNLGNLLASMLFEWNEQASITIIRESDELPVYQFVTNQKAQRNIDFAMKKRIATKMTGHSSFWTLVKHVLDQDQNEVLEKEGLPVAGAFPIYVDGKHEYTICVSGMHEGKDYVLVVNGMAEYLDVQIPKFNKTIF